MHTIPQRSGFIHDECMLGFIDLSADDTTLHDSQNSVEQTKNNLQSALLDFTLQSYHTG